MPASPEDAPRVEFPAPYSVDVALSVRGHDRAGHRRTDEAWLADAWADSATRVLVLAGGRFPLDGSGNAVAWLPPDRVPEGRRLFLGVCEEVPHFLVVTDEADTSQAYGALRMVGPRLPPTDAALLVHAVALVEWLAAHRFCPRCGGALVVTEAGHVQTCEKCGRQQFPRTDPAVIMLVTDGERALLGRQEAWPPGRYSTLAGFVEPGESLEQAVVREVREEVGVEVADVAYFASQPWPFPASLMVGFFAHAVTTEIDVDGAEIADARWFTREELREEAQAGSLVLPGPISISRSLVEAWYGGPLPGQW